MCHTHAHTYTHTHARPPFPHAPHAAQAPSKSTTVAVRVEQCSVALGRTEGSVAVPCVALQLRGLYADVEMRDGRTALTAGLRRVAVVEDGAGGAAATAPHTLLACPAEAPGPAEEVEAVRVELTLEPEGQAPARTCASLGLKGVCVRVRVRASAFVCVRARVGG